MVFMVFLLERVVVVPDTQSILLEKSRFGKGSTWFMCDTGLSGFSSPISRFGTGDPLTGSDFQDNPNILVVRPGAPFVACFWW